MASLGTEKGHVVLIIFFVLVVALAAFLSGRYAESPGRRLAREATLVAQTMPGIVLAL